MRTLERHVKKKIPDKPTQDVFISHTRCCMKEKSAGSLPVMVGYDGSQSSDTYSVAHQMNFLTQEILHPVKERTQST